jgi:O-acetyl-ADP-ribose deacetylase (regulator of RNase III)
MEAGLKTIAFPCISTGIFRFPQDLASEIAIRTVLKFLDIQNYSFQRIIFNVYSDSDFAIYESFIKNNL